MSEEKSQILDEKVDNDTPLKEWLVNYVGEKHQSQLVTEEYSEWDETVTVEMIVETVAEEFPEFLLAVAEENFIRGYEQALTDVDEGEKLYNEQKNKKEE